MLVTFGPRAVLAAAAIPLEPHPAMILPFAGLLLSIAVLPFLNRHWWETYYPIVAVGLGSLTVLYYLVILKQPARLLTAAHDYTSFIALAASLFVVASGIHIRVAGRAKPWVNCVFLLVGGVLANVIGTTGASMLLIRPWIRMNKWRITGFHVVFFIFIVSNVGGCLTPIGDPPLFLGYLKGVPFWWVLQRAWPAWAMGVFGLIAVFWMMDRRSYSRARPAIGEADASRETWKIEGLRNVLFLVVIQAAVFLRQPPGLSELLMAGAALGAYFTTPKPIHDANHFSFGPVREVAWLFAGIFATMVPALDYFELHAREAGLNSELRSFWFTGTVSAVLDNAPTYLSFLAAAMGRRRFSLNSVEDVQGFLQNHPHELLAVSLGAVFFGAVTYIGNGPNFMVKSIAEHAKVSTPSFFAYLFKYALPILLPVFALVSLLFFSRWRWF